MNFNKLNFDENYYVLFYFSCVYKNLTCKACCSAGKCRIAGKRNNLRKMSQRRREMSQSAENVVNPTAGICRIVDGKCRKKNRYRYMSQHRREMSQLLLLSLHLDNLLKRKQQVIKFTCI